MYEPWNNEPTSPTGDPVVDAVLASIPEGVGWTTVAVEGGTLVLLDWGDE